MEIWENEAVWWDFSKGCKLDPFLQIWMFVVLRQGIRNFEKKLSGNFFSKIRIVCDDEYIEVAYVIFGEISILERCTKF